MYSYDNPLLDHHSLASVNFATQTVVVLPCAASADLGDDPFRSRQPRNLANGRVLGLSGVVATAGTGTISIGDGTTADRYGTITLDATVTAGNSLIATIELTEEGCHMGVADINPATTAFTLTFSGAAVVNNVRLISGHW